MFSRKRIPVGPHGGGRGNTVGGAGSRKTGGWLGSRVPLRPAGHTMASNLIVAVILEEHPFARSRHGGPRGRRPRAVPDGQDPCRVRPRTAEDDEEAP
jgi:hypothetical protein